MKSKRHINNSAVALKGELNSISEKELKECIYYSKMSEKEMSIRVYIL